MRKALKYNIYNKINLVSKFPLRILNFKRPKWFFIQQSFKLKDNIDVENSFPLVDITKIMGSNKVLGRVDTLYRERMMNYSFLSAVLRHSVNLKKLKANKNSKIRHQMYLTFFFNFYYKVCNLTYMSDMLTTSFEARQKIVSKSLLVNNSTASTSALLRKGDVISLSDNTVNISKIYNKFDFNLSMLTNVEIDYYSQTIVLIKDSEELSAEDFYLLSLDFVNFDKFD